MTLTTEEAAVRMGVTPRTVRRWVASGLLRPIRPEARVWRYREDDVIEADYQARRRGNLLGKSGVS